MSQHNRLWKTAGWALLTILWLSPVHAGVHFAALPDRAAATLTLTGSGALVEEDRLLSLERGINEIRFSWQGLPVSEDSVRLLIQDHEKITDIVSVSHPTGEPAMIWRVYCSDSARMPARISYVLFRIDGFFPLRLVSNEDETSCRLDRYLVLRNFSGEDFEDLSVITRAGTAASRPVRHGETIRTLLSTDEDVKIEKIWRYDSGNAHAGGIPEGARGIPVYYRLKNNPEAGLGRTPIPGGKVRVFHKDGRGELKLLGEDEIDPVRPGGKGEIFIGRSRDIAVNAKVMKEEPVNVRRNRDNRIMLYDTEEIVKYVIENFKDAPATLNLLHRIPGQWEMVDSSMPFTRTDARVVELEVDLEPGSVKELTLEYRRRNVRP